MFKWLAEQIAKFSIGRFFAGFNILNGEKLGKILFVAVISFACWFIATKFLAPKIINNTAVTGENVTVQQCDPKSLDKMVAEARANGKNSALIRLWFIRMF